LQLVAPLSRISSTGSAFPIDEPRLDVDRVGLIGSILKAAKEVSFAVWLVALSRRLVAGGAAARARANAIFNLLVLATSGAGGASVVGDDGAEGGSVLLR